MRATNGMREPVGGRPSSSDWSTGYEAGKRAYELASSGYRSAQAYLVATSARTGRSHAWVDGFKTGWSVASDD
jgi:hypothetical protein